MHFTCYWLTVIGQLADFNFVRVVLIIQFDVHCCLPGLIKAATAVSLIAWLNDALVDHST